MTTPNTLKATLTADVGEAQVSIQRLITTVENMGKTVNATSAAGQKAFKAEADEVAHLVRELGASEKQLTRLTSARTAFAQRVKTESMAAASAAAQMATAHGAAAKDVVKGLASIAAESKVTTGGLRDILNGVGSLAFAFGPAGAFVSAVAIGTSSIVGLFSAAREEMEHTQRVFKERIEAMRKDGNSPGLVDEVRRLDTEIREKQGRIADLGTPAKRSDIAQLLTLRRRSALQDEVEELQRQRSAAAVRALNPDTQYRAGGQLAGVTVTANAPGFRAPNRNKESRVDGVPDALGLLAPLVGVREQLSAIPTGENSPLALIAADAAKPVSVFQALRVEIAATGGDLKMMGETAKFALTQGVGAGLDALITGRGNVIKALKRTAAEPIVAELKMNAIKGVGDAAKYAASFNFPAAAIALASATKNTLGAVAVARLGGLSGGGGNEGVSAGGAGGASPGRGASLPGDGLSAARSDRPIRIEMIVVSKTPDGRELSRQRQIVQRLDDRNQPIRVTL